MLQDGAVDLCLDFTFVAFVEELKPSDVDAEAGDDTGKHSGRSVSSKSIESSNSASDCEETSGVNFCGSQLILELGSLEVQAGVGHSRFVDSDDDCSVGCGVYCGTLVACKVSVSIAHFFLLWLGKTEGVTCRKI